MRQTHPSLAQVTQRKECHIEQNTSKTTTRVDDTPIVFAMHELNPKTRPKHPTDVDFDLDQGQLPTSYLRDDIRLDEARHPIFSTDAQLSLLQKAKTWYVDVVGSATTLLAATDCSCLSETCNCDKATTSGNVHHEPASQGRLCCRHAIDKEFIVAIPTPETCSRF
ncbi:hypothetical protein LSH36_196g01025 [Paralvinella palmiformis]|uniref:Uncharacterized protein n=1 Tax=Paralvinella palmiformis TaxID=53620 RepID=A0AAD9N559_9ANNE|nr:hypothetical protein LSH36_196g01025 [Paralvinella palmiformis]